MAVASLERFTGPNGDIPLPAYAEILPPLLRGMEVRIAVIAEETLTPIGNTADETWESIKAMRHGFVEKRYPPYTEPRYPIPNEMLKEITADHPVFQRLLEKAGDNPQIRNYILGEFMLEESPEKVDDLMRRIPRPELAPQLRSIAAGTVKNFNPREAFKFRFDGDETDRTVLPIPEIMNRMDPFAQYSVYTGVGAARKVYTHKGIPLIIPRIGPDGQIDKKYPLTINPDLVHPSYFGIYEGCGFGGGDVSAVAWERMKNGQIPTADHMMLELLERGASQLGKAVGAKGGGEGDVGACASSGKAAVNLIHSIMLGDLEAGIWVSTEGVLGRPIAAASFDAMSALDQGKDINAVSLSLHKNRRGFIMGEGAVAFVLADPNWCRRHGIKVLYEIIGYGNTSDAWDDTRPNGEDGERALRYSRRQAELQGPIAGKLLESGHYTATLEGDGKEHIHTINAYEDLRNAGRLIHGATKRLVGHMLGAAGAIAQFAAGKAIQEGVAFGMPRAGELMDEAYGSDIPQETRYEPDLTDGVSKTFGFGGHNVALNSRRVR